MTGGWNDPEALEQERFNADTEMAELEARGREAGRSYWRMERLRAAGKLAKAAQACPHGIGYPLKSPAASNAKDPRAGQDGVRCSECGSVLSAFAWDGGRVLVPCDRF